MSRGAYNVLVYLVSCLRSGFISSHGSHIVPWLINLEPETSKPPKLETKPLRAFKLAM